MLDTSEGRKPIHQQRNTAETLRSYMRTLDNWFEVSSKDNTKISDTVYPWQNTITKCFLGRWNFKVSKTNVFANYNKSAVRVYTINCIL